MSNYSTIPSGRRFSQSRRAQPTKSGRAYPISLYGGKGFKKHLIRMVFHREEALSYSSSHTEGGWIRVRTSFVR